MSHGYKIKEPKKADFSGLNGNYSDLTKLLLSNRGITDTATAERFLSPDYDTHLYDPFLMKDMDKAVSRIIEAIDNGEKIVVYGDYDCDGIPASVILHDFFKKIGYANFANYIPHRHREGYGLNTEAIDVFSKDGVNLIITVDLAISNVAEVAHAESLGINVIVTDHHLPPENLPKAFAVINAKQIGDNYPDKMLSGAGVAWKLVQALLSKRGKEWGVNPGWEKWLLDMAGLSTIADMVPLLDENRVLVHYGLKVLRKSSRLGLLELLRASRANQNFLNEDDVSFTLAPRINAASRMDEPIQAFKLLSTTDPREATTLAVHLDGLNNSRKGFVGSMVKEAKKHLESREIREVIVTGSPSWRPGLLGLVASALVEEYNRPAFVWGREESEFLKGSCRSDGSVNVVELMASLPADFFLNVGGHEFSGGFSITHEKIHLLEDELISSIKKFPRKELLESETTVDAVLLLDRVNEETFASIDILSPFGIGNPKPMFLFEKLPVFEVKKFGKEKNHLEIIFKNSRGESISAISFFAESEIFEKIKPGEEISFIGSMEKSFFKRVPEIRIRITELFV